MVEIKLKNVNRVKQRLSDGRHVEYHSIRGAKNSGYWKSTSGVRIGSPEYIVAYQAATAPKSPSGKFENIIRQYLDSGEFRELSTRTKSDYRGWLDRIRMKFGSAPITAFNHSKIRAIALRWRDEWSGRSAQYAWAVLRRVVFWACDRGLLEQNHFRDGGQVYQSDRAEIIWTEEEIAAVEAKAPPHIGRALRAAVETGLRPGDLIELSRDHIEVTPGGRRIKIETKKRKRTASIPVTEEMGHIIDTAPGHFILTNAKGAQWSAQWLSKSIASMRTKTSIRKELRLYDARGSAVTRLVLANATLPEVAIHMGWSVRTAAAMIEKYAALDPARSDSVLAKLRVFEAQ